MMGGPDAIMARGRELYAAGQYRHAQEILNKLVFAHPDLQPARDLLADTWEQLGYQQESTSVRNSFLAGALELRSGIPQGMTPKSYGPDLVRAMSTGLWLDYLAVRLNSDKAGDAHSVINIITPDNGEQFVVELSHGTLTSLEGFRRDDADLTLTIDRQDLEAVMMGQATLADQAAAGKAKLEGDPQHLTRLLGMLDTFKLDFQILPGTGGTLPPHLRGAGF
jgi:alkyl sulfatase BDS1-like metallo-beta-lactamase superfamily hydrolase